MSGTGLARTGVDRPALRFGRWPLVRRCVFGLYLAVVGLWTIRYGIPVQRELVIAWICGGLLCLSLGRHPRQILEIGLDWLPLALVLAAYDLTRGLADTVGVSVEITAMIDFDRFLFLGQTPTEWLQARLHEPGVVTWLDLTFSAIYTSYFIVPFAVAGVLWARERAAFKRFTRRLVTLALAGLATYVAFPAAPPWMAAEMGLLEGVDRTTSEGFHAFGVATVGIFDKGQQSVNLVAAVPSLHAAFTALVAIFLWDRVRPRLRPLLALYPLAMALTLVTTGEHYVFDILLGWAYAAAAMAAWGWWERRSARRARDAP